MNFVLKAESIAFADVGWHGMLKWQMARLILTSFAFVCFILMN